MFCSFVSGDLVLQLWQQRLFLFLMRFQADAGAGQRGGHLDQGLFVNVWLCLTISQMTQKDTKKQMWNNWMLTVTIGSAEENGKTMVQKVNKMLHVLFRLYQKKLNPSVQQTSRSRWATSPLLSRFWLLSLSYYWGIPEASTATQAFCASVAAEGITHTHTRTQAHTILLWKTDSTHVSLNFLARSLWEWFLKPDETDWFPMVDRFSVLKSCSGMTNRTIIMRDM